MVVKIKKLVENAVIPAYSKKGDAGLDLTAVSVSFEKNYVSYKTGLAVEIPEGFVGLLFPRSSNSKTDLYLTNHVGVVDSGYRGEIMFKFRSVLCSSGQYIGGKDYGVGDRVGQLVIIPYPSIEFEEVTELSITERNTGGYGSTGN